MLRAGAFSFFIGIAALRNNRQTLEGVSRAKLFVAAAIKKTLHGRGFLARKKKKVWGPVRGAKTHTRTHTYTHTHTPIIHTWSHGHMVTWSHGHMVTWSHGHMVTWSHGQVVFGAYNQAQATRKKRLLASKCTYLLGKVALGRFFTHRTQSVAPGGSPAAPRGPSGGACGELNKHARQHAFQTLLRSSSPHAHILLLLFFII